MLQTTNKIFSGRYLNLREWYRFSTTLKLFGENKNQPPDKPPDNKPPDNKIPDDKIQDNKTTDNKTLENKTLETKTADNKTLENKTTDNKTTDNKTPDNKEQEIKIQEKQFPVQNTGIKDYLIKVSSQDVSGKDAQGTGVFKDDIKEGVTKEGLTKEGVTKEGVTKEVITKEAVTKESHQHASQESPSTPDIIDEPQKRPKHLIAVHCGYHNPIYVNHIKAAIEAGYKILEQTGKSLEAVEAVCRLMESNPVFNCGKGSVLTSTGVVEMEASIMDGKTLTSGAVSGLNNIEHPVTLAKVVMEKTPHIAIAGKGANQFAQALGFPRIPPQTLVTEEEKEAYAKNSEVYPGLSAVIALDPNGNLATAMSSGGMRRKLPGRVGCCATVGTGYYADNRIAAVVTSDNAAVMKANLAYDIVYYIGKGLPPLESAQKGLLKLQLKMYVKGGAMVVTKHGHIAVTATHEKMDWAFKRDGEYKFGNTEGYFQYMA